MTVTIRPARPADETAWRTLWQAYLVFYGTTLPEAVTATTWARCLDPAEALQCRIAERDGAVVGFAMIVVHRGTWHIGSVCYLEDLFIAPAGRRLGAGRAMLDALVAEGREQSWAKLYWQTKPDNAPARALYDQIGTLTDFVRYERLIECRPKVQ